MFGDTTSKTLELGSLDDHAEALARMLDTTSGTSTNNGGGAVAAANDGATGAAIHPALVLLNHRFLQEVQRHERAMAAVKIAQEEVPDTDGAPSDTPAGSPPDVQQSEAARDGNFFFMAALQLLEARAQSRRGVVLPDTNMSALAVPATPGDGTDADDDSTLPFGSPAPLSAARSRDLAAADVILSGWLMKHSDFHWKSKYVRGAGSHPKTPVPRCSRFAPRVMCRYVVVRCGELAYSMSPQDPPRRFKRIRLDSNCVIRPINTGARHNSFELSNLQQRGSKRTWRAKSQAGTQQRWWHAGCVTATIPGRLTTTGHPITRTAAVDRRLVAGIQVCVCARRRGALGWMLSCA